MVKTTDTIKVELSTQHILKVFKQINNEIEITNKEISNLELHFNSVDCLPFDETQTTLKLIKLFKFLNQEAPKNSNLPT